MDTIAFDIALVPVIVGLVQVSKPFIADIRWYPVLSLVLSILLEVFLIGGASIASLIFQGVLVGLAASGLYSGQKTLRGISTKE